MDRMDREKLELIAHECGVSSLRVISRTGRSLVLRGSFSLGPHAGKPCMLKIIKGSHSHLMYQDRLFERVMACQAIHVGEVPSSDPPARRPHRSGLPQIVRHAYVAFPDGEELVYELASWIPGITLDDYLLRVMPRGASTFPLDLRIVSLLADVVLGLSQVVAGGVLLHRDIRPSNILVSGLPDVTRDTVPLALPGSVESDDPLDLRVALIDFDTAWILDRSLSASGDDSAGMPAARSEAAPASMLPIEVRGASPALGTPGYTAPEGLSDTGADQLNERVDIYSLGVVAHEVLTGRWPYPVEEAGDMGLAFWREWLRPGARVGADVARAKPAAAGPFSISEELPDDVAALIASCLDLDPACRPTALEAAQAFDGFARDHAGESRRLRRPAFAATGRVGPTPVSAGAPTEASAKGRART